MTFGNTTPILRMFDEAKAREFYVDFLGFTPGAAAELTGIDPHTLRTRLYRARGRLRTRLEVVTP